MKQLPVKLILSFFLQLSVVNCENRQEDEPFILNKENYRVFADIYSQNLNTIASGLRAANSTFANSKSVISVVENSLEEDVIASFRNNYVNYISDKNRSSTEGNSTQQFNLENLSEIRREYVQEILGSVGLLGGPAGAASGALTGCLLGGAIGAIGGGLVGYATFC